jgi:3-oxoacyl-[acyl-carrier protein] reductase
MSNLSGKTTIVVGASRGLGHGIAIAFADAGARVVAVSRTAATFPERANGSATIQLEVADAGDATVAASLLDRYEPEVIILVAGALPYMRPLQHQTWETFSVNWETDVRITFQWLREALLKPLRPGSRVVVISSGAPECQRVTAQRGVRRRQGHSALHHRLRSGRSGARRCRY